MNQVELYNCLYGKLAPIVSEIDPGHLGGARGEYDRDINEIIRIVMEQKRLLTAQELKDIFKTYTGDFATLDDSDTEAITHSIRDCVDW